MSSPLPAKRFVGSVLACLLLVVLVACGGTPAATPAATTAPAPAATAAPAAGQAELPLLNEAIDTVTQAAAAKGWTPLDSVPAPDAQSIYFTANGSSGPAVYKVAATGGDVTIVASGAPLIAPWGLSISTDGQTLYVADLGAEQSADGNVLFALPAGGGTPTKLETTAGSRPNVPEVVSENGVDMLYYSGFDSSDQQPAIFKLNPAESQPPTVVFKGAPLVWPSGVAVTKAGVVYVVDLAAAGNGQGAVFRIQNGATEKLADQLRTSGWIAGAALTLDEAILLVSNLQVEKGTAQVLAVNLSTGKLGMINKGIANNTGAGGVHRAHRVNQFSWADCTCPRPPRLPISNSPPIATSSDGGGVYFLTTP
jgi:DNA-binding beta-propeller fold protein YncE